MPTGMNLGFVVVFGLAVVFICLIALIILINVLGYIINAFTKKPENAAAQVAPTPAPAAPVAAPAAVSSVDKQKIIAAIGAAIAEDMGTDVAHIKIHSIKKI